MMMLMEKKRKEGGTVFYFKNNKKMNEITRFLESLPWEIALRAQITADKSLTRKSRPEGVRKSSEGFRDTQNSFNLSLQTVTKTVSSSQKKTVRV